MRACCIVMLLLCASVCGAEGVEQIVRAKYEKVAVAAEFKYVDGLLSNRASNFHLLTPQGQEVDLTSERGRFVSWLDSATRVRFSTEVLDFKVRNGSALFRVQQLLTVETVDPVSHKLSVTALQTICDDLWVEERSGWKICLSQVREQRDVAAEPLPIPKLKVTEAFRKQGRTVK